MIKHLFNRNKIRVSLQNSTLFFDQGVHASTFLLTLLAVRKVLSAWVSFDSMSLCRDQLAAVAIKLLVGILFLPYLFYSQEFLSVPKLWSQIHVIADHYVNVSDKVWNL